MTTSDFRPEPTAAGLIGTVTYRCAACHKTITGEVSFVTTEYTVTGSFPKGLELTPDARTYHPHHIPKET